MLHRFRCSRRVAIWIVRTFVERRLRAAFRINTCSPSLSPNTSARPTSLERSKSRLCATSLSRSIPENSSASSAPRAAASRRSSTFSAAWPARLPASLFIDDIDFVALNDAERTRMRKARIGFVFQKFNLLPTLTARGQHPDWLRDRRTPRAARSSLAGASHRAARHQGPPRSPAVGALRR